MNIQRLRQQLVTHEGVELKPYRCTSDKLTIGVGRNIEDRGISHATAMQMLDEDIDICINELQQTLSYWNDLPSRVKEGMYSKAADELLDSRYANQVGQRAVDVANMIRDGAND